MKSMLYCRTLNCPVCQTFAAIDKIFVIIKVSSRSFPTNYCLMVLEKCLFIFEGQCYLLHQFCASLCSFITLWLFAESFLLKTLSLFLDHFLNWPYPNRGFLWRNFLILKSWIFWWYEQKIFFITMKP